MVADTSAGASADDAGGDTCGGGIGGGSLGGGSLSPLADTLADSLPPLADTKSIGGGLRTPAGADNTGPAGAGNTGTVGTGTVGGKMVAASAAFDGGGGWRTSQVSSLFLGDIHL